MLSENFEVAKSLLSREKKWKSANLSNCTNPFKGVDVDNWGRRYFFLKFSSAVSEKHSNRNLSNYFVNIWNNSPGFWQYHSDHQIIKPTLRRWYLVGLPKNAKEPTPHSFHISLVCNLAFGLYIIIRKSARAVLSNLCP